MSKELALILQSLGESACCTSRPRRNELLACVIENHDFDIWLDPYVGVSNLIQLSFCVLSSLKAI